MNKHFIKYIVSYIIFFILFYSENFDINGVSFSQLWKIPLVLYMLYVIFYSSKQRLYSQEKYPYRQIAFKQAIQKLMNYDFLIAPIQTGILFIKYLNFPLLLKFIPITLQTKKKVALFLIKFCHFGILSYIPFLLNIIEEPKAAYGTEEIIEYGSSTQAHIGLFQNPHGASVFLSIAFFVIIYYIKHYHLRKWQLYYNYLLLALCLYCLYTTYVRTGYVMFIIGFIVHIWPSKMNIKYITKFICLILIFGSTSIFLLNTNPYFKARICELDANGEKRETKGSGRLIFAQNGINLWLYESNLYQYIMGHGQEAVKDNNAKKLHNPKARIYSHNGYIDALAQNGIIGIILMLLLYYYIFRRIYRSRNCPSYRLALGWLLMQLSFQLFQGGVGFMCDLLAALILTLIEYERQEKNTFYRKAIST